ncbi:proline-rich membrane anchor 1 isoform X2 [Hylobates moloch]|uniref:proline-rich membrane anchor 1 isoform X2 n=1 Tax=Hylobates moloch TaxID=81572 RepID=UPI002674A3D6|nr:proline-rich membrane anchor 1 isoform X2 [Hylobates moloch]
MQHLGSVPTPGPPHPPPCLVSGPSTAPSCCLKHAHRQSQRDLSFCCGREASPFSQKKDGPGPTPCRKTSPPPRKPACSSVHILNRSHRHSQQTDVPFQSNVPRVLERGQLLLGVLSMGKCTNRCRLIHQQAIKVGFLLRLLYRKQDRQHWECPYVTYEEESTMTFLFSIKI